MTMARVLITNILLLSMSATVLSLQCVDPSGKAVDWYASYKAPVMNKESALFKSGLALYYLDVNAQSWSLSQKSINESGTAVYNTLQQVYKSQNDEILYVMYNDQKPGGSASSSRGHTKGVVAFDGQSGFWLIHSVPYYPPYKCNGYSYPSTGTRYGQSFLCISLSYDSLGSIGKQLVYNEPHIYDYNAPRSMVKDFPVLEDVIHMRNPPGPPWYSIVGIQSLRGQKFTSFAKATNFSKDLYTDLVAPTLKDNLLVETWMNGQGQLRSNCSTEYKVYNAMLIHLPDDVLFKRTKDHSKWATSVNANKGSGNGGSWTCIGDINRMLSQYKRGGGTVCVDKAGLWNTFRKSVEKYEPCP